MPRSKARPSKKLGREEILRVAFWEVYTRGFQGVSVDEIVEKTALTKGAFYHHFPRKLDLGYALVDEVLTPMILDRWIRPLEAYQNPVQGILRQLEKCVRESPQHLRYGCPLNNLVQEMAPLDAGFKKRLEAALELWISETERHLLRAQANGVLGRRLKAREIAEFVVMAHEGFYGILKGAQGRVRFESLLRSLKLYFAALAPESH